MNGPADPHLLLALVLSAGLGALVGILRQWTDWSQHHRDDAVAGARTFALWAMLGCISTAVVPDAGPVLLVTLLGLVGAHQIVLVARLARHRAGATSFAAILLTILAGALVARGRFNAAIVMVAVTAIVLGVKRPVHAWTRAFTGADMRVALQFLAVTGVILPIVPDKAYGPYAAFNPYSTWLMVVLISGIGFAAYVVMRWAGERAGILIASVFGGLASSTASALAFTRRSRDEPRLAAQCAIGVIISSVIMFVRVDVIVAFFNPALAVNLITPFVVMVVPPLALAGVVWMRHRGPPAAGVPAVANPLNLGAALKFGVLYAVIAFLVKYARGAGWHAGILPLSFVSGLSNLDAITLSLARGGGHAGAAEHTAAALVIATVANTVLKAGIALVFGAPLLRRWVAVALGWMAVAGVAAAFLV